MSKELDLKKEDISFKCSNPKCSQAVFRLTTDYLNGYGELACPMCFSHNLKVIFLNYIKVEKKKG